LSECGARAYPNLSIEEEWRAIVSLTRPFQQRHVPGILSAADTIDKRDVFRTACGDLEPPVGGDSGEIMLALGGHGGAGLCRYVGMQTPDESDKRSRRM
jgi:hypothetical protein